MHGGIATKQQRWTVALRNVSVASAAAIREKLPTDQSPHPNWRMPDACARAESTLKRKATPSSPRIRHIFLSAQSKATTFLRAFQHDKITSQPMHLMKGKTRWSNHYTFGAY